MAEKKKLSEEEQNKLIAIVSESGNQLKHYQALNDKLQKELTTQATLIKQLREQKSPEKKDDQLNDQRLAQVQSDLAQVKADLDAKKQEKIQQEQEISAQKQEISAQKQEITTKTNQYDRLLAENTQLQNNIPAPYLAIPLVAGFALGGFLGYNLKPKKKKHRDIPDINSELI
jgi:hypothetical protein